MKKRKIVSAPKDFTVHELPQTRKEQFFNIFKNQYMTLLKAGLILLLFFLPYLAVDIFRNLFDAASYDPSLSDYDYGYALFIDMMIQTGIEFLLLPVLAVAFAGLNNVFKTMVEGDCVLFKDDFKEGVKGNYRITLPIVMVFGVFFLLLRFLTRYFMWTFWVVGPVYAFFIIFIIPLTIIALLFSTYYQGNYFNVVSNSTKLYPAYWWEFLLSSVVIFFFILGVNLGFDGNLQPYFKAILYGASIVFLLPMGILLLHSIAISLFDKHVNAKYYPENAGRGLYNPKIIKSKKDSK